MPEDEGMSADRLRHSEINLEPSSSVDAKQREVHQGVPTVNAAPGSVVPRGNPSTSCWKRPSPPIDGKGEFDLEDEEQLLPGDAGTRVRFDSAYAEECGAVAETGIEKGSAA